MDISKLEDALENSWSMGTCYPGNAENWTLENPSYGQCAVTALVVQDYFEGDILYCASLHHYWNELPNGEEKDFTKGQFPEGTEITRDGTKTRTSLLNGERAEAAKTKERYLLLKQRVQEILDNL